MSNQVRVNIQRGLGGFVFGCSFYLILSGIAKLFLNRFLPFSNEHFPLETPLMASAAYAVAMTLSTGLWIPFNSISTGKALMLTSVISGVMGMLSILIAGAKRGLLIFFVIFILMIVTIACPALGMFLTG